MCIRDSWDYDYQGEAELRVRSYLDRADDALFGDLECCGPGFAELAPWRQRFPYFRVTGAQCCAPAPCITDSSYQPHKHTSSPLCGGRSGDPACRGGDTYQPPMQP
eukprot:TRINITY_DN14545_c0_g1_i2.p4 TRINITY_DN14545_c0_g1~~TRINITY_DN14545_c0_g1_i2.p4  ORF type:complete len:106 (-),score=16.77 TRINITY_DN14545_c0_g1_i2:745-1062(-)